MRWYQRPTVAGVVVALGITGGAWFARPRSSPQPTATQRIEVVGTRISPSEGDAVIEAERGISITVRYSLRNQSATVLTDLVATPGCRCQILDSLPSRLEPGKEAIVSLQMGVPEGGTKEWLVPITCAERREPLLVLTGGVRAKANPPEWTRRSSVIQASLISGEAETSLGLWESVELRSQKQWLASLSCTIEGIAISFKTSKLAFDRSGLVKRQFQLFASGERLSPGQRSGEIVIHYTPESGQKDETIPLIVEVSSAIAVVPPKVDFSASGEIGGRERRVTLFDRRGGPAPHVEHYDSRLLSLEEEVSRNGRTRVLRIRPQDGAVEHHETVIGIESHDGLSESFNVRLSMKTETSGTADSEEIEVKE